LPSIANLIISLDHGLNLVDVTNQATDMKQNKGSGVKLILAGAGLLICAASTAALTVETITYTYDTKGRLVKVEHAGAVNNGVQTAITHDAADNRRNVKVVGAPR
jgi:hypothetical protein